VQFCNLRYNIPRAFPSEKTWELNDAKLGVLLHKFWLRYRHLRKCITIKIPTNGNASEQVEHLPRCTQNVKLWSICNKLLISDVYTTIIIALAR